MRQERIPGLATNIIQDGAVVWSKGYGYADLTTRRPMSPDTVLNIASVTKLFTATAVMQMIAENRFSLDDDAGDLLPFSLRNPTYASQPITIRQLLMHTSSVNDDARYWASYTCGDPTISLESWLSQYFADAHLGAPYSSQAPGRAWQYSNVGFDLLGLIVERTAQRPYPEVIRARLLVPLGMEASGFLLSEVAGANLATPYELVTDTSRTVAALRAPGVTPVDDHLPLCAYSFPTMPDGLLRTSTNDLSRFLIAFMQPGTELGLSAAMRSSMTASYVTSPSPEALPDLLGQGFGWHLMRIGNDRRVWGHTGGDPGVRAIVVADVASRHGAVMIVNTHIGRPALLSLAEALMACEVAN